MDIRASRLDMDSVWIYIVVHERAPPMSQLPLETRVRVAAALVDGVSIRATERLLGVHRDSIMKVGLTAGEACARLHDARVRDLRPTLIEADEIWTFVA